MFPPIPKTKNEEGPKKRFQYLQKLIAEFWKKWTTEYLSQMQTRSKNMSEKQNLTKGDLVYITDDNSPLLSWPLGIVHETYTRNGNLVRVAKIKTGNGKLDTNQHKLSSIQKIWKMVLQNGANSIHLPVLPTSTLSVPVYSDTRSLDYWQLDSHKPHFTRTKLGLHFTRSKYDFSCNIRLNSG